MTDQGIESSPVEFNEPKPLSYNDIASKLLNEKFLLTALEFHTELIESGRELKQLKDFFSNPGNFEQHLQADVTSPIPRSGSQATLDSLDLTRFSEDGERGVDERVAVLEFELRKAKETITALRTNLTVATESENTTPDTGTAKCFNNEAIKPHEQRALNFLINEYLLTYGYKLTSITFADENENQDFEDWDDVGLNIPKPAELLPLYREGLRQAGHDSNSVGCQINIPYYDEEKEQQILNLNLEIDQLKRELSKSELIKTELQSKYDNLLSNESQCTPDNSSSQFENENISTKSATPENFEVIDKLERQDSPKCKSRGSIVTLDDDESATSLNENDAEWTRVGLSLDSSGQSNVSTGKDSEKSHNSKEEIVLPKSQSYRKLPSEFQRELISHCFINVFKKLDNNILEDSLRDGITNESFVHVVSQCMPRIIPNIILNKREEVIPLLISAVHLNPVSSERDCMLQQLFNLKKRPSEDERRMILSGIVGIAKSSAESLVENEVLPQCWEQLTHKHVERRLLVAESCSALTPYVSSTIRNSLMLSMLQQLLEDRDALVKEKAVKALALVVAYCDDSDKYSQCEDLALSLLYDTNINVVNCTIQILMPVLAEWALTTGKLHSALLKNLLHKLNQLVKLSQSDSPTKKQMSSDEIIIQIINVLDTLLPFVLVYIGDVEPVVDRVTDDLVIEIRPEFAKLCTALTNPNNFYTGNKNIGIILYEFDKYIKEEPNISWIEIDWFLDIVLPDILNSLNHIDITQHSVLKSMINFFAHICIVFGKNFTTLKIKPIFQTHIQNLEQMLLNFNQYTPNFSMIPVYLISVLSYCGDVEDLCNMLKRFVCALPLCGTPLDCLDVTVRGLCEIDGLQEAVVIALWEGVVHQRPLVRSATAGLFAAIIANSIEQLLCSRIAPALVTLASDPDILVRTATLPALGSLITDCNVKEVHDKAYMQLQSFLSDSSSKDNHAMLRQLVVTLGHIVNSCDVWFREEVILPQLAAMSAYTSQMSNQTRKIDMASALIESFSATIYCPLSRNTISTALLPGLKYLEAVDNKSLVIHRDTILAMIRETESRLDQSPTGHSDRTISISQNVNQGMEDVRQRVSKIFSSKPSIPKSNNLGNLQGMFRKK